MQPVVPYSRETTAPPSTTAEQSLDREEIVILKSHAWTDHRSRLGLESALGSSFTPRQILDDTSALTHLISEEIIHGSTESLERLTKLLEQKQQPIFSLREVLFLLKSEKKQPEILERIDILRKQIQALCTDHASLNLLLSDWDPKNKDSLLVASQFLTDVKAENLHTVILQLADKISRSALIELCRPLSLKKVREIVSILFPCGSPHRNWCDLLAEKAVCHDKEGNHLIIMARELAQYPQSIIQELFKLPAIPESFMNFSDSSEASPFVWQKTAPYILQMLLNQGNSEQCNEQQLFMGFQEAEDGIFPCYKNELHKSMFEEKPLLKQIGKLFSMCCKQPNLESSFPLSLRFYASLLAFSYKDLSKKRILSKKIPLLSIFRRSTQ